MCHAKKKWVHECLHCSVSKAMTYKYKSKHPLFKVRSFCSDSNIQALGILSVFCQHLLGETLNQGLTLRLVVLLIKLNNAFSFWWPVYLFLLLYLFQLLTGNRKLPLLPVALSLAASFMSAIFVLGVPAEAYVNSTEYWLIGLGYIPAQILTCLLFMPIFYNLKLTSAYQVRNWNTDIVKKAECKKYVSLYVHHTTVSTPAMGHRHLRCYNRRRYKRQTVTTPKSMMCGVISVGGVLSVGRVQLALYPSLKRRL